MELQHTVTADSPTLMNFLNKFVLIPIHLLFNVFEKTIKQLSQNNNKEIIFKIERTDINVLEAAYRPLLNSLIHVFRNSVDHGIEEKPEIAARTIVLIALDIVDIAQFRQRYGPFITHLSA